MIRASSEERIMIKKITIHKLNLYLNIETRDLALVLVRASEGFVGGGVPWIAFTELWRKFPFASFLFTVEIGHN